MSQNENFGLKKFVKCEGFPEKELRVSQKKIYVFSEKLFKTRGLALNPLKLLNLKK